MQHACEYVTHGLFCFTQFNLALDLNIKAFYLFTCYHDYQIHANQNQIIYSQIYGDDIHILTSTVCLI